MAWINASTSEYWGEYNYYDGNYYHNGYLGNGHWEWDNTGIDKLSEMPDSPIKPVYNEYNYTYSFKNKTVSGIRIHYSFSRDTEGSYDPPESRFQFETNFSRMSPYINDPMVNGSFIQEWTFDPEVEERITKIIIPWGFSGYYSDTAIITKIELFVIDDSVNQWTSFVGTTEYLT